MAWIFLESMNTPLDETINPRYSTCSAWEFHFEAFRLTPASLSFLELIGHEWRGSEHPRNQSGCCRYKPGLIRPKTHWIILSPIVEQLVGYLCVRMASQYVSTIMHGCGMLFSIRLLQQYGCVGILCEFQARYKSLLTLDHLALYWSGAGGNSPSC